MPGNADQRQYIRYPLGLDANAVVGNNIKIRKCVVNTISHNGVAMDLLVREELVVGQNIMLAILLPGRMVALNVIVKLKWFEMFEENNQFNAAAGGVIVFIKNEDRSALLDYAFKQVLEAEKKEAAGPG
jgi:hypothetical protein